MKSSLFLAVLTAMAPAASAQRSWVVDANGGGDFRDLPAAYDRASAGDTLLVRRGSYRGFFRGGPFGQAKGLRILGDDRSSVFVDGSIRLQAVPAGQSLVVSGLTIVGNARRGPNFVGGLVVDGCDRVTATDLVLRGDGNPGDQGGSGLSLSQCDAIVDRVSATGGDAVDAGGGGVRGGNGASLQRGRFAVSNCRFRSGDSAASPPYGYPATAEGCLVVSGDCVLDETACTSGIPVHPTSAGLGALWSDCTVRVANYTGQPITTLSARGGATIVVETSRPSLVGPSSLTLGQTAAWTVRAAPATTSALVIGLDAAALTHPLFDGTSFLAGNAFAIPAGLATTGANGVAVWQLTVPSQSSLRDAFAHLQAYGPLAAPRLRTTGVSATRIR